MKRYIFISLMLCLSTLVFAQDFIKDSLDNYVLNSLDKWKIPGAAVLVIKDGKVLVMKGYGVRELGKNDKVDENTLFMIGSNTKAFTGTAIAMLEAEGKCSTNDKVKKWLPELNMQDKWVENELTLSDVLSHRIGMSTFQGDFMYWDSDLSQFDVLEKFGKITPDFSFRTKWGYTNAGFLISGLCIKNISGLSWAEFMKERIFKPLEMNNTNALSIDFPKSGNFAYPHSIVKGKCEKVQIIPIDNLAPAGSINSSVNDMSKWVLALLDSGRYNGKTVIPYSAIKKTREPLSIVSRSSDFYTLYGMGWDLDTYNRKTIVSHTGGVDGFVTSVTIVPEMNLGIVVLTNTDENLLFMNLKSQLIDYFMEMPYKNYDSDMFEKYTEYKKYTGSYLTAIEDTIKMGNKLPLNIDEFAGKYKHNIYGNLEIEEVNGQLELTLEHHSKVKGLLKYIAGNRFLCIYNQPIFGEKVIEFEIMDGKIKNVTISVSDFIERGSYTFVKQ